MSAPVGVIIGVSFHADSRHSDYHQSGPRCQNPASEIVTTGAVLEKVTNGEAGGWGGGTKEVMIQSTGKGSKGS